MTPHGPAPTPEPTGMDRVEEYCERTSMFHDGCNYNAAHFPGGVMFCNKCGWLQPCPDCVHHV